jgi:hypothetical protein
MASLNAERARTSLVYLEFALKCPPKPEKTGLIPAHNARNKIRKYADIFLIYIFKFGINSIAGLPLRCS